MSDKLIVNLPFEGFYESKYSGEVDHVEEQDCEHLAGDRQDEEGIAPELRLDAGEFAEIFMRVTDYKACYTSISKAYVDAFDHVASEHLEMPLGLTWESMDSPREYNFATDRVYAHISVETVTALFARSASEGHKRLREAIKARFTSRSGFHSHYDNTLASWLERDVTDWDHNELCTLLGALLGDEDEKRGETLDWAVYYRVVDGDGVYGEWSEAVDWAKFDELVADARAEKLEELREIDPEHPLCVAPFIPVRCPLTVDLFTGREG